jgi:hypothetical protein
MGKYNISDITVLLQNSSLLLYFVRKGEGPEPHKIYEEDGYEYLKNEFPEMDYIERCEVVEILGPFDHSEL